MEHSAIDAHLRCARACQQLRAGLQARNGASADLLALLLDAAECCELSARWMQRGSPFAERVSALCDGVCKRVEEACRSRPDDEVFRACLEACKRLGA